MLDEADETFREMEGRYPFIGPLRELRYSLSKLRLNDLKVGSDGRNRTPLWAFGTKTARNAPSASAYVFGPAKWTRMNVAPPPGRTLIHRDYPPAGGTNRRGLVWRQRIAGRLRSRATSISELPGNSAFSPTACRQSR